LPSVRPNPAATNRPRCPDHRGVAWRARRPRAGRLRPPVRHGPPLQRHAFSIPRQLGGRPFTAEEAARDEAAWRQLASGLHL